MHQRSGLLKAAFRLIVEKHQSKCKVRYDATCTNVVPTAEEETALSEWYTITRILLVLLALKNKTLVASPRNSTLLVNTLVFPIKSRYHPPLRSPGRCPHSPSHGRKKHERPISSNVISDSRTSMLSLNYRNNIKGEQSSFEQSFTSRCVSLYPMPAKTKRPQSINPTFKLVLQGQTEKPSKKV